MLALLTAVSCFCFAASASDGRVEIVFKVGDSTLTINGAPVTVETPYVVGAGVTLVPVRVITEAFGATVGWDGETRTVTLQYPEKHPEVTIVIQIDNPIAEINGIAQNLLSAPELTQSGITMVPLRFISENFGAIVSYDEATQEIKVVKEAQTEPDKVVEAITQKYIGDSYYGWAIENSPGMYVYERSFDGTYTCFDNGESMTVQVYITGKEDYDLAEALENWKSQFHNMSLVKAELADHPEGEAEPYLRAQAMDKTFFADVYEIVSKEYIYCVKGVCLTDAQSRNEMTSVISSFLTRFPDSDVFDVSEVSDGLRTFNMEEMNLFIGIPQDFILYSEEGLLSKAEFVCIRSDDLESYIYISIFSKEDGFDAKSFADSEYESNRDFYSEKLATFNGRPVRVAYDNMTVYEYSYYVDSDSDYYAKDVFFDVGNYVYNVYIRLDSSYEDKTEIIEKIINSIDAGEIDFDTVGPIIRNNPNTEGSYVYDRLYGISLELPRTYYYEEEEYSANFERNDGAVVLLLQQYEFPGMALSEAAHILNDSITELEFFEVLSDIEIVELGDKDFAKTVFYLTDTGYYEHYVLKDGDILYSLVAGYDKTAYSRAARAEIAGILESIEFTQ